MHCMAIYSGLKRVFLYMMQEPAPPPSIGAVVTGGDTSALLDGLSDSGPYSMGSADSPREAVLKRFEACY